MAFSPGAHRLAEIDFLRGVAIILVLFSHHWLTDPTQRMGWIGVDLFFVLSGFLVSGLLFNEYKKFGSIDVKRFLIRRGFKIYPSFYFSIAVTTVLLFFFPNLSCFPDAHLLILNYKGILAGLAIECLFLQSYFFGFWGHHWSLAVEEHFYLFLVILLLVLVRKKVLENTRLFVGISLSIFAACLSMRIVTNLYTSDLITFTATHLRIDSLFAGVVVSYFYHFHLDPLKNFYAKYRLYLLLAIVPLLGFTPFVNVLESFFVKTIGFTLITAAFCCLLLVFLFESRINEKVGRVISARLYSLIATQIGFYSYGIYLFHFYVVRYLVGEDYAHQKYINGEWTYLELVLSFCIYFVLSIFLGVLLSKLIETPMLKLRDKWFPRRSPAAVEP
ncbi:MAG: acyltransferase [Acidobacteriota bacterium]